MLFLWDHAVLTYKAMITLNIVIDAQSHILLEASILFSLCQMSNFTHLFAVLPT